MSLDDSDSSRTKEILKKYPHSDYLAVPESFQRLTEATVLHELLDAAFNLASEVNVAYVRDYLDKNEDDRKAFLSDWKDGDFSSTLLSRGTSTLLKQRETDGTQVVIYGGSFKEIHGNNYEIGINIGEDDQSLMNWLSSVDFIPIQRDIYRRRADNTGNWFLSHPDFKKWRSEERSCLLWCPGIPGAGKSVIASAVVHHLQKTTSFVVFVYFDYKRQKEQTTTFILGSLARQLYSCVPQCRAAFKALHKKHKNEHLMERQLADILRDTIQNLDKDIFCILDALDEYSECYRDATICHLLELLTSLSDNKIKMMFTSRILGGMESLFKSHEAIRIEVVGATDDIQTYVRCRVLEEIPFAAKITEDIVEAVLVASKDRFLQARLNMDHICTMLNTGEIRDALPDLSANIDDSYTLVLERIEGQSKHRRDLAHRTLSWVAQSFSLLTETKLQEALATARGRKDLEDYITPGDRITAVCAGLIVIEEESRLVKFIHMTAFEYFLRIPSQLKFGHPFLARTCMDYILIKLDQYSLGWHWHHRKLQETFLGYSLLFWGFHCMDHEEALLEEILEFMLKEDRVVPVITGPILRYPSQMEVRYPSHTETRNPSPMVVRYPEGHKFDDSMDVGTPLHIAAYFRLPRTLAFFLAKPHSVQVNAQTQRGMMTPLAFTAAYGDVSMVRVLVGVEGIDLNMPAGNVEGDSPLLLASRRGNDDIVELLLQQPGIDIKPQPNLYHTPLFWASVRGHDNVVQRLLGVGAGMNHIHNALMLAIHSCNESIVDQLLAAGGDPTKADDPQLLPKSPAKDLASILSKVFRLYPNAARPEGTYAYGPLFMAAERGHHSVVKLLLKSGLVAADDRDPEGCSALSHALRGGFLEIANTIFDYMMVHRHGIYEESRDNQGRSELSYAARNGLAPFVERFLRMSDVDPNQVDNHGRSPLSHAADYATLFRSSHFPDRESDPLATVTLLIDHGVPFDDMDKEGRTPLSYAATKYKADIVRILLQKGADPNKVDYSNRSPLSYSVGLRRGESTEIAELLIKYQADVDQPDAKGRTPLSYVAEAGYPTLLSLLLEHGAKVDSVDEQGRTPLTFVAHVSLLYIDRYGKDLGEDRVSECAQLLLDNGSAVNHPCAEGRTPLSYAAEKGRLKAAKVLLDHQATVDQVDTKGRTPLSYAFETRIKQGPDEFDAEIANVLLARGANPYMCDVEGKTPLDYGGLSASDLVVVETRPDESTQDIIS